MPLAKCNLRLQAGLALVLLSFAPGPGTAQPLQPIDYSKPSAWLCRPGGGHHACSAGVTVAAIGPAGTTGIMRLKQDPKAAIDCFYVYPTVSKGPGVIAGDRAGPEERYATRIQFAAFASACRPFAPIYRQYTVTAMKADLAGRPLPGSDDPALTGTGYGDVLTAWRHYLAHDNRGRGVVLIGHSQGARVLSRLIAEEIDGKSVQGQLVSALLIGRTIPLDRGKRIGLFKSIPLCGSGNETGCLIAYSTYRDRLGPSPAALFGKPANPAQVAACSNPGQLARGTDRLEPYLANGPEIIADLARTGITWVKGRANPRADLVAVPGLLSARCVEKNGFSYLEVHVAGDPRDTRLDDIKGDVLRAGAADAAWGLHLIDMNIALGDLVAIVRKQGVAFVTARSRARDGRK